jgi:hypothetical protein
MTLVTKAHGRATAITAYWKRPMPGVRRPIHSGATP